MGKKRIRWMIYPKFQLTLVVINLLLFLAFLSYFFYQVYSSFQYMNELGLKADLAADHPYFRYLGFQKELLFKELTYSSLIFAVLSVVFTILLSHRLAGPMFSLRQFLEEYCQFRTKRPLSFRKNDFFQEIPDLVNRAIKIASGAEKNKGQDL